MFGVQILTSGRTRLAGCPSRVSSVDSPPAEIQVIPSNITIIAALNMRNCVCVLTLLVTLSCVDTQPCSYTLSAPHHTLTSLHSVSECQSTLYTVHKASPRVCQLQLQFNKFHLQHSPSCRTNFLSIAGQRYCGSLFGTQEFSFENSTIDIQYETRQPDMNEFEIELSQKECVDKQRKKGCRTLSNEIYTEITNHKESNCQHTITPAHEDICRVQLHFHQFNMDCGSTHLIVGGEMYCGNLTGSTVHKSLTGSLTFSVPADDTSFRIVAEQIACKEQKTLPLYQQVAAVPGTDRECCSQPLNSPYMVLASPAFPHRHHGARNCQFTILPDKPQSCRVRIHLKYFWLGEEDVFYGCVRGFLEVDGRRYCGCRDGLTLTSYFDNAAKVLFYHSVGADYGFVAEIFQEDCGNPKAIPSVDPKKEIEVFSTNRTAERKASRFLVPTALSQCHQLGPHWLLRAGTFLLQARDALVCRQVHAERCEVFHSLYGQFQSSGYPFYYPPNLRACYRFPRQPGFCQVQISMTDFDVEWSVGCWKDHVLLDARSRFCGQSLQATAVLLNYQPDGFAYMDFTSDTQWTGRGFRGFYHLLPCRDTS